MRQDGVLGERWAGLSWHGPSGFEDFGVAGSGLDDDAGVAGEGDVGASLDPAVVEGEGGSIGSEARGYVG